ncbi:hypothetical protein T08_10912 [Trichinella sp. T8]|nr:hypothetical protein T08_10912 [Trichinella sp. T8]
MYAECLLVLLTFTLDWRSLSRFSKGLDQSIWASIFDNSNQYYTANLHCLRIKMMQTSQRNG